jgi:hypothetical protein
VAHRPVSPNSSCQQVFDFLVAQVSIGKTEEMDETFGMFYTSLPVSPDEHSIYLPSI